MARAIFILVVIFIIFLLVAAAVGVIYYKSRHSNENVSSTYTTYIKAVDEETNELLDGRFKLTLDNQTSVYLSGETKSSGYVKYDLPKDHMWNFFVVADNYYTTHGYVMQYADNMTRDIPLYKIGNIKVEKEGDFHAGKGEININISTDKSLRGLNFCLAWGTNTIKVDLPFVEFKNITDKQTCLDYGEWKEDVYKCDMLCKIGLKKPVLISKAHCENSKFQIPKRLQGKVDKCYSTGLSLYKSSMQFALKYENFDSITDEDYIKLIIIDSDKNIYNKYVSEDESGNDIGAKDFVYIIKNK